MKSIRYIVLKIRYIFGLNTICPICLDMHTVKLSTTISSNKTEILRKCTVCDNTYLVTLPYSLGA